MHIRPHGKGWRCDVEKHGRRLSKTFRTKREAQAWGNEQEGKIEALGAGWRSFAQAAEDYERTHTTRKRAQAWERNTLARLVAEFGAATPLGSIDAPRIARWRDERLLTVSGSTVNREANLLRNLLRVARLEWQWISHDPFAGVRLPKENAPRHQLWRWQDIRRVLRAQRTGKTAEMQRAFHIALRTGMRLSEVLSAKLSGTVALLPKDKMTDGPVKVPLTRHGRRLMAQAPAFTVTANEGSVLFGKLCRELLIEGLTFHDSRATALTHLSRRVDVLTLSKISRHRDLQILRDHYYRETPEQISARL